MSPRGRVALERLKLLEADGRVRAAGLVCATFGLDPVAYLDERDPLKRLIRLAAHNAVQDEENKAAKRSAAKR